MIDRRREEMSHYKDLRDLYAKSLEYHGIGRALFQPVAASDMTPPCVGYLDRNGDFNQIARLSADEADMAGTGLTPLAYLPPKVSDIGIQWQPKTSYGMTAVTVDASGNSPENLPGGADAHIKYVSNSAFGAVLMTRRPIQLTAYNDERLFLEWLEQNKLALLEKHGQQLKKYGMWIVTRIHAAPACWINAWQNKKREAVVSVKAKAGMLGAAGNDFSLDDMSTDRDWTGYCAKDDAGIVVFMDGIEVRPMEWKFDDLRENLTGSLSRSTSRRRRPSPDTAIATTQPQKTPSPLAEHRRLSAYQQPLTSHPARVDTRRRSISFQQPDNRRLSANYPSSFSPPISTEADEAGTDRHSALYPRRSSHQRHARRRSVSGEYQQGVRDSVQQQQQQQSSDSQQSWRQPQPQQLQQARPLQQQDQQQQLQQARPLQQQDQQQQQKGSTSFQKDSDAFSVDSATFADGPPSAAEIRRLSDSPPEDALDAYKRQSLAVPGQDYDQDVLRDVGALNTFSRSGSLTRGTLSSRSPSPRTPSLRRETRTVSKESIRSAAANLPLEQDALQHPFDQSHAY